MNDHNWFILSCTMILVYLLLFSIGTVFGSFLGAWTYRLPRKIKISSGRSFCPKCKKTIEWYDNIPLLSFLVLRGKCRYCGKNISYREPLIELIMGILFSGSFYLLNNCAVLAVTSESPLCKIHSILAVAALPYFLLVTFFLIAIFVIDIENKIIPDELSFFLWIMGFILIIFANYDDMFLRIFMGFATSLFLLTLHLITKGAGMGLGDVKLVLFAPLLLGSWQNTLIWIMGSFIIGAVVGILLLALKRTKLKAEIPFGPFLITSFYMTLILTDMIGKTLFLGITG